MASLIQRALRQEKPFPSLEAEVFVALQLATARQLDHRPYSASGVRCANPIREEDSPFAWSTGEGERAGKDCRR